MPRPQKKTQPPGEPPKEKLPAVAIVVLFVAALTNFWGLEWGIPGKSRNELYFTTDASRQQALDAVRRHQQTLKHGAEAEGSDEAFATRSLYNPVRSYHPDEYYVLKSLSHMRPEKLEFDPGWYVIGGAYIYPLGATLKLADVVGFITLKSDATFYFEHPTEMGRIYVVGRALNVVVGAFAVMIVMIAAHWLWGARSAVISGVMLVTAPLFAMNSHFMYNDIPGLFWVSLVMLGAAGIFTKGKKRYYSLAGFAAGMAAGTKLFDGWAILLPLAAHFFRPEPEGDEEAVRTHHGRMMWAILLAIIMLFASNPFYLVRFSNALDNLMQHLWTGPSFLFYLKSLCFGFGVLPLAAAAAGLFLALRRRNQAAAVIGLWALGYYVVLCVFGKQFGRYILPTIPALAMMCGWLGAMMLEGRRAPAEGEDASPAEQGRKFLRGLVVTAALIVVVAPQVLTDLEIVRWFRLEDSRTVAGRWIANNVPAGSTIGVTEEPWQFEMPPIDMKTYHVEVTGYDAGELLRDRPAAFVFSDLQSDPDINPHPDVPGEPGFWKEVFEGSVAKAYREEYRWPADQCNFYCALWLWQDAPEDMQYVSPRVFVLMPRAGDGK